MRMRRTALLGFSGLIVAAGALALSACGGLRGGPAVDMSAPPSAFLAPTPVIDSDHPATVAKASELVRGIEGDASDTDVQRQRALAVYRFVRDEVRFGFEPAFYEMKASSVLRARRGYCNTKSTLFVALLRAAGVPARPVFVDLDARLLSGVISPGTVYVDHSYTEVWLDGRWVAVDSYITDPAFFERAQARLSETGGDLGFGVHARGVNDWDGVSDSFAQYVNDDGALGSRTPTVHADVMAYYRDADDPFNRKPPLFGAIARLTFPSVNARIDELRRPTR